MLVKPQAAVIGPVVFLGSVSGLGKSARDLPNRATLVVEGVITAVMKAVIVLLPFILVGQLPTLIAQIQASAGRQQFLTMNAHNFWYLLTLGRGSFAAREANPILDTAPLLGPLTGWQIGLLLFLFHTLFTLYRTQFIIKESPLSTVHFPLPTLFWAAAGMVIGFYMLPAEAHERYLFPVLALLVPLLPGRRPYQLLYLAFTATLFLNLLWVDSPILLPAFTQSLIWGIPISAVNVSLFIYYLTTPDKESLNH
jgi:hypothetical protein